MSDPASGHPLDDLRRANPVAADELPSASLARVRARVEEETHREAPERRRWRQPPLAALGAGIAVAAIAVVLIVRGGFLQPPSGPSPSGLGVGFCVEQYSLETLGHRAVAFDGSVTAITADNVTFVINRTYRGAAGSTITLAAPGMTGVSLTPAGGPSFQVGQRYLVAGEDGFAWACGFSQPYDPDVALAWGRVFGS